MSFACKLRALGGTVLSGALLFGTASAASADQIRDDQWPLKSFNAEEIEKISTGQGVIVAVIDDGVNGSHPDLAGNVLPGKDFTAGGPANKESKNNHGTTMSGEIAGHGHGPGGSAGIKGLAPSAKILPIKWSNMDGSESAKDDSYAQPLRYAVDHGAKIVNMSFGVQSTSDEEKDAIAYAVKHDVLLVSASGNEGSTSLGYPASSPGVLTVGAVGSDGKVWKKSNYGPQVLLTAPGVHIRSTGATSPYGYGDGTSDSAAYVSGAAALIRAKFPHLSAGQVANRLTKTALIPSGSGVTKAPDEHYGYGFIRPLRALTEDIPAGPKNGPLRMPEGTSASPTDTPATSSGSDGGDTPDEGNQQASSKDEGGLSTVAIVSIAGGVLAVAALVIGLVVASRRKNDRNGPPPGGPGAPGAYMPPGATPGYPPQPNSYQQPPTYPGNYPPGPPAPPPGR
ncbi:S8 family serine peptidase [Streptomyces chattanoogensis]|uniref:Peptidase M8 n=1 Tax=Streptomyces chattanoogensis TaxID=66876 RepID=A0A0N0XZQ4_9ACTN|nr:S8 family serine peptidase [Streptomyces chattanoogensis]KPC66728.1 peptidase M8 [Streptomyces chattanoogensis]